MRLKINAADGKWGETSQSHWQGQRIHKFIMTQVVILDCFQQNTVGWTGCYNKCWIKCFLFLGNQHILYISRAASTCTYIVYMYMISTHEHTYMYCTFTCSFSILLTANDTEREKWISLEESYKTFFKQKMFVLIVSPSEMSLAEFSDFYIICMCTCM